MSVFDAPIVAEVWRGAILESIHRGRAVAWTPTEEIYRFGDPHRICAARSTIKPYQAIPFILSGAARRYAATTEELAIVCASHDGEAIHRQAVARLLDKAGLQETHLQCGGHEPATVSERATLYTTTREPGALYNNCSGKHAGMLLTCLQYGDPIEDYLHLEHPTQRRLIAILETLTQEPVTAQIGIDGCSAPTFGVSLVGLARAAARYTAISSGHPWFEAATQLMSAMTEHPHLVGGTQGRLDTELMRVSGGRWWAKIGAEAVYTVGVRPCDRYPLGLGIAFKIEDGSMRALDPFVVAVMDHLGLLSDDDRHRLAPFAAPALTNRRGAVVGQIRPHRVDT